MAPLIFLTDTLMDRRGMQSILSVKLSITIDTMLNFDADLTHMVTVMILVNRPQCRSFTVLNCDALKPWPFLSYF